MNNYFFRNICIDDFNKGHINLLKQLSYLDFENIPFMEYKNFINNLNNNHQIIVLEFDNKIIGTGTILIEKKIIHNFGLVAHIEDVVIDHNFRGNNFGKKLIYELIKIAKDNNCYKIILDCNQDNINFYEKCGFKHKEYEMVLYL